VGRSSRVFLVLVVVLGCGLALAACPHGGSHGATGPRGGKGAGSGAGGGADSATVVPVRKPGTPMLPPEGIGCAKLACVYHAGAAGYFTCPNGASGTCFHYGGTCAPADGCMFDAADGRYKTCASPVEGTCTKWGAACTPTGSCMFNPKDGLHHSCAAVADGRCTKWGGLCDPA